MNKVDLQNAKNKVGFDNLVNQVSKYTGVAKHDLLTTEKMKREVTTARHLLMFLIRERGVAYHTMAEMFGRNKHTGVMHGSKTIENLLSIGDKDIRKMVAELNKEVN